MNTIKSLVLGFSFLISATSLAQWNTGRVGRDAGTGTPPVKEWTYLVYMNSDNNLYSFGFLNMMQMEKVGSSDQVNVVVQMDPQPRNLQTTRYYVTKNPNAQQGKITSQVVGQIGETNMGDPKTLTDFLVWGAQNYPAKHYAVVVWNHGGGWVGVSYDDNPASHLTTPQVRQALEGFNMFLSRSQSTGLRRARKVDLINFDACLMSTLEVAYELKDVANYLVASQYNEPGEGENYTNFLTPLVAKPQMTARELAEIMVYQYVKEYNSEQDINYAAWDLSRLSGFTQKFNQSMTVVNGSPAKNKIRNAFGGEGAFDFISGMTMAYTAAKEDPNAAQALDSVIQNYGYPREGAFRLAKGRSLAPNQILNVVRSFPGTLYFRANPTMGWKQIPLQRQADGMFAAQVPFAQAQQYSVLRSAMGSLNGRQSQEAVSTFFRKGRGETVTFHNNFPETSPLVADAYSMETSGAHGMTLYSLAGKSAMMSSNPQVRRIGAQIQADYKQLLFASQGAPAWTQFFGF